MCSSPRTEYAQRTTPIYMWHEQAIVEWSWRGSSANINVWTIEHDDSLAYAESDHGVWTLLLLAATGRSFTHMSLKLSDRNKMVLWPGCEGCTRYRLHIKKNVRLVWFVVKRKGCCCNLSVGVALNVRFTMNGMCAKNNTHIYVARTSNNRVIVAWKLRRL